MAPVAAGTDLRLLVVEDSPEDFDVLMWQLRRLGYAVEARRVETKAAMQDALVNEAWDLVISDWSLPTFGALEALETLRESRLDLPFILVTGTVGEEIAVEAIRRGAHDLLVKDRLGRLGAVIDRELRDAQRRRDHAKLREQLMISDRMASVGVLAAGVAHEINNPLAAVLANLDLAIQDLEAGASDPKAHAMLVEEIQDARAAADRVRQIVRDLKIFSRHEADTLGLVDVSKVMDSTLRMASNEIRHRARLVKTYRPTPPVRASEARLGQAFLNLVVNAAQALPEGQADRHHISIDIDHIGDRVVARIADTGPGIPAEVLSRLFTPFVTTKPAGVGTGLGLSICHRIVSDMNGEITVDTKPGKGTVFTISIPIAAETGEAENDDARATTSPVRAVRRARVLVVDDEPIVARAIERAIHQEHDVVILGRGRDAFERIRGGERFDVIVCDVMMPEMTGIELHRELEAIAPDQAAAIIFLTGGVFTAEGQSFLDSVANPRIEKPFVPKQLRVLVNEHLRAVTAV